MDSPFLVVVVVVVVTVVVSVVVSVVVVTVVSVVVVFVMVVVVCVDDDVQVLPLGPTASVNAFTGGWIIPTLPLPPPVLKLTLVLLKSLPGTKHSPSLSFWQQVAGPTRYGNSLCVKMLHFMRQKPINSSSSSKQAPGGCGQAPRSPPATLKPLQNPASCF